MPFTPEELQIINFGKAQGKSMQEVEKALTKFRQSKPPEAKQEIPKEKGLGQRLDDTGMKMRERVSENIQGTGAGADKSLLNRGVGATAAVASGVVEGALDFAPKPIRQGMNWLGEKIGKGFNAVQNRLADTDIIKGAAGNEIVNANGTVDYQANDTSGLEDKLGIAGGAGEIAGDILAVAGGAKMLNNGVNLTKKLTTATTDTAKNAYEAITSKTSGVSKYPKQFADGLAKKKINPQTQTILKEVPVEKLNRYVKAGEEALKDPRKLHPFEQAGETAERINQTVKTDMGNIGAQKAKLLEQVGQTRTPNIAIEQINKVKPFLQKKLTEAERKLVNGYLKELDSLGKNPTAASVDALIDKLQAIMFEKKAVGAIPMTGRVKSFLNQSLGELNGKLKNAVDTALGSKDYSALNGAYRSRIKIFNALNRALGEEGQKGGSLFSRFFSSSGGTPVKNLFAEIKQIYGVDLAHDATLAKFVMDTLGDTRSNTYLKLPPTSPAGIINRGLEWAENKMTSPEKVFGKARTMTNPK